MERGHVMVWVEQAARASLQRPYNDQLMTPHQLFDWACSNIRSYLLLTLGIVAMKINGVVWNIDLR